MFPGRSVHYNRNFDLGLGGFTYKKETEYMKQYALEGNGGPGREYGREPMDRVRQIPRPLPQVIPQSNGPYVPQVGTQYGGRANHSMIVPKQATIEDLAVAETYGRNHAGIYNRIHNYTKSYGGLELPASVPDHNTSQTIRTGEKPQGTKNELTVTLPNATTQSPVPKAQSIAKRTCLHRICSCV